MSVNFRWADIKPTYVEVEEMNALFDKVSNTHTLLKSGYGTTKIKAINTYCVINDQKKTELRVCDSYNEFKRYTVRHLYECDELKEEAGITGMEAYNYVNDLFQEKKRTNLTLYKAFSGNKYIEQYRLIKNCVPKQIAFINSVAKSRILENCYKADVSSAFPYQMTKTLPTLHDCKVKEGIVKPTEEYPFAFYVKSGHLEIYNELDTRKMKKRYYQYSLVYDDRVKKEEETTILCKASQYNLKDEFEYMYSQRKIDVNQKMYMNACIGYFHRNGDPRLSHIAAVVLARNNKAMLDRAIKLEKEGNIILYIATDSIVWKGTRSDIAVYDKYLGSFTYEGENGKFFGRMVGAYQYLDENNILTTKCSYLKNNEEKASIKFGELPEPKYATKFILTNQQGTFKLINIFGE